MSIDFNKLAMQTAGDTSQQLSGMPSDQTSLAMALGFRPNLYANPYQQQQNMYQFMAMQKNIMDQMMGGPNGAYAKMAPGNPMAAMPLNYQNYMNSAAGLFTNPMTSPTMPGGGPAAGGPNGYQFGPVSNNMSPMLQGMMQQLGQAQSNQMPSTSLASQMTGPNMNQMNPAGGGMQSGSNSPVTVNTAGGPLPKTQALLAQLMGSNSIPQGTDPYDYLDNIISQALQSRQGGSQSQDNSGGQGGMNPLAVALQHLP